MKNHYSLNPGEFFVVEELRTKRKDLEVYIPVKDHGWDLLAIKGDGTPPVRIQVKESRTHSRGNSWHQVRKDKLQDADVFVFVTYVPEVSGAKTRFTQDYVVVPCSDLEQKCKAKKTSKGIYRFYFGYKDGQLMDFRGDQQDFSKFRKAWHLI